MHLDLRWNSVLGEEHTKEFNDIAIQSHDKFNAVINDISLPNRNNIDWWLSTVASRNIFISPLFYRVCCISFLIDCLGSKKNIDLIYVESKAFAALVNKILDERNYKCKVTVKKQKNMFIYSYFAPKYLLIKYLFQALIINLVVPKKKCDERKHILIDTFISYGYEKNDRYYPGLWELLSEGEKDKVLFVPSFYRYSLFRLYAGISKLLNSNKNWIFKEHYLKIEDYLSAARYWRRLKKINIPDIQFRGLDISAVIKEELNSPYEYGSAYAGLLNYKFFNRILDKGVQLDNVIDWHENQSIDKGWNAGVNYFYPNSKSIGYQGFFASSHYQNMFPTKLENDSKILPKKLGVIGYRFIQSRKKYCPEIEIVSSPAFRYKNLLNNNYVASNRGEFKILCALPKSLLESNQILNLISQIMRECRGGKIKWFIKLHPTNKKNIKNNIFNVDNCELIPDEIDIKEIIVSSNVVISSASSVCVESIVLGTPLIIYGGSRGLIMNPVPVEMGADLLNLCYTKEEIINVIDKVGSEVKNIKDNLEFKDYINEVDRKSVKQFVNGY